MFAFLMHTRKAFRKISQFYLKHSFDPFCRWPTQHRCKFPCFWIVPPPPSPGPWRSFCFNVDGVYCINYFSAWVCFLNNLFINCDNFLHMCARSGHVYTMPYIIFPLTLEYCVGSICFSFSSAASKHFRLQAGVLLILYLASVIPKEI